MSDAPESKPTSPERPEGTSSNTVLPWDERWDEIARERFHRTDWIELAATVLMSLATIVAALPVTRRRSLGISARNREGARHWGVP